MIPVIDDTVRKDSNTGMRRWFALLLMCCLPLQVWAGTAMCAGMLPGGEEGIVAGTATCHHAATDVAADAAPDAATDGAHDCRHCLHCVVAAVPLLLPALAAAPPQARIALLQTPRTSLSHAPGPRPPSTV
jgi:hypothetical protein